MNQKLLITGSLGLLAACLTLEISAVAQQKPVEGASDKLNQAVLLRDENKPQEARTIIATIDKADASYGAAMCCDALCLYDLNDKKGFLKALESPSIQKANISSAFKEDLEFKQIDALFYYRRFDDITPKLQAFKDTYKNSTRSGAVDEYNMALLFERGMKKTYEAGILKDTNEFNQHWSIGRGNLVEFLSQASSFSKTNYQVLSNRTLKEEIWLARLTLGDEQALLKEIPAQTADRERMELLGIQLAKKLQPTEIDENLQRMKNYLDEFPESKGSKQVEYDMANISFSRGEALIKEADIAKQSGDVDGATAKRAEARTYFNYTRALEGRMVVDPAAGVEVSDVLDRQDDLLNSYYLEKDYARMESLAATMIKTSAPGELGWMMGKNYQAIAAASQTPPDLKQAASELDDVLALKFNNRPDQNRQILVAAKWRIYIAQRSGNDLKAGQITQWVQDSACTKNQKANFLKIYSGLIAPQGTISK